MSGGINTKAMINLPKGAKLWRWHIRVETEGNGKQWLQSELMPEAKALREANARKATGHEVRVEICDTAAKAWREKEEKREADNRAFLKRQRGY